MHLFKKVVDTSFLGLKPAGKITRATMTPGAEQNCLEQLIMQLLILIAAAVFSLGHSCSSSKTSLEFRIITASTTFEFP